MAGDACYAHGAEMARMAHVANRGAIALTLCAAHACGGPRTPAGPVPIAAITRRYLPLGMKADAKLPSQAVILGTSEHDDSTVLPLPTVPTTATVEVMLGGHGARRAVSGSMTVALTTAPSTPTVPGLPHISGIEGTSARWTANLWSAAVAAASALGKDLADVAFSATSAGAAGAADDASGSALVAVGFLATITGAPISPVATLAGTIEPDGTIGPAAAIPEQFLDAIARGKTVLGYPTGMRFARSQAAGKDVDLVQLAQDHHARAVEVANLGDAYALVTGKRLPAPVPVTEADMALDPATIIRLDATYVAAQQQLGPEWAALLQLEQAGRLPTTVQQMVRVAHDRSAEAEALHRAGKLAAAYSRVLVAWVYAVSANHSFSALTRLASGDIDGAIAVLTALDTAEPRIAATFAKLGALRPPTLGGQLAALAATQAALRGWASHAVAAEAVGATAQFLTRLKDRPQAELTSRATADTVTNVVAPAVVMMVRTLAEATIAEQELDVAVALSAGAAGVTYPCSPAALTRLAAGFQATTTVGLRYLDALMVEPLAHRAQITAAAARQRVANGEPDYLLASFLSRLPSSSLSPELAAPAGDPAACPRLTLAIHELASRHAWLLITKYDSLAVHTDDTGKIDAVGHPAALRSLLASAKRTARANARAARIATGAIPLSAKLAYQIATVEETGNLDDQISALGELWAASAFSQTAVMLARN